MKHGERSVANNASKNYIEKERFWGQKLRLRLLSPTIALGRSHGPRHGSLTELTLASPLTFKLLFAGRE